MKILEKFLTKNPVYKRNLEMSMDSYIRFRTNGPQGAVLHSVGCSQPSSKVFYDSWNKETFTSACVHAFIDANTGEIWQTLPWDFRGAHGASGPKGSVNNTHIGVEMCESNYIQYTGGSTLKVLDLEKARKHAVTAYNAAVELFAYLSEIYHWDPMKQIISHKEGHEQGIASDHGDPEHYWNQLGLPYTMDTFRREVKEKMQQGPKEDTTKYTKIMGTAVATAEQMKVYIKKVNIGVPDEVLDMIPIYLEEGTVEGLRGDIAFAQSCLETGNFTFKGSAVDLSQNNFCGMGVTSNGMKGNSFSTPREGIRAQIQHLKAYASVQNLKNDCVDPRYKYVTKGCAEYVEWLGIQENPEHKGWAAGAKYGVKILEILKKILESKQGNILPETKEPWYLVRKTFTDVAGQKGAFHNRENAIKLAEKEKCNVYDEIGNVIYSWKPTYVTGEVYTLQTRLKVRKGPGTSYQQKHHAELTTDGKAHDSTKTGCLDKGTRVTAMELCTDGQDVWMRSPSGWLAAYYQGNIYIK